MNDNQLNAFIITSKAGSFSKAAEELYVAPSAVIKQISLLERDLGFPLFQRTYRGVILTGSGESFLKDIQSLMKGMEDAILRARQLMDADTYTIRIGTSPLSLSQFILNLWPAIHQLAPDLTFQLVPYENNQENAIHILNHLGLKIDIVACIFDDALLKSRNCTALELNRLPLRIAVPIHHPLARQEQLCIQDLFGETLMLIQTGWNSYIDRLKTDLVNGYPQIHIEYFSLYDINIFNQCERECKLLLVIDNWKDVHPLLKVVPVDWEYTIPFGVLHSLNPSKNVSLFIQALKTASEPRTKSADSEQRSALNGEKSKSNACYL